MQQIEITSDIVYKVTSSFEVIANNEDKLHLFIKETDPKYQIYMKEGTVKGDGIGRTTFNSVEVYQCKSEFENLLTSGQWKYQFQTARVSNVGNSFNSIGKLWLIKQYRNEAATGEWIPCSLDKIIEVLKEFDSLPQFDVYTENDNLTNENRKLRALIAGFKKKINGTLKRLK